MTESESKPDDDLVELNYEPASVDVQDGSAVIGDIVDFLEETKSVAVHMRDGQMWVLRAETLKWMKIEEVRKADKTAEKKDAGKEATVTPIRKKPAQP